LENDAFITAGRRQAVNFGKTASSADILFGDQNGETKQYKRLSSNPKF